MPNTVQSDLSVIIEQAFGLQKAIELVLLSGDKTTDLQTLFDRYQDFQNNVNNLEEALLKFEGRLVKTEILYPEIPFPETSSLL